MCRGGREFIYNLSDCLFKQDPHYSVAFTQTVWLYTTDKKIARQLIGVPVCSAPPCLTPYNVQDVHNNVSYSTYQGLPQLGSRAKSCARTSLVRLEQVSHSTHYSVSYHAREAESERRFKMFCRGRSPLTN